MTVAEFLPAWHGVDPERVDAAYVRVREDGLVARGTSVGAEHALSWSLDCGPQWVTRELVVNLRSDRVERELRLSRDGDGVWSATRAARPAGTTAPLTPVALRLPDLAGALDCDLGLCPLTNLMPVLRHDLVAAARLREDTSVRFVMAWVSVPQLTVEASVQRYTALAPLPDGGALVRFTSGDFTADLHLDPHGLVRHYPGIATSTEQRA